MQSNTVSIRYDYQEEYNMIKYLWVQKYNKYKNQFIIINKLDREL